MKQLTHFDSGEEEETCAQVVKALRVEQPRWQTARANWSIVWHNLVCKLPSETMITWSPKDHCLF